MAYNTQSTSSTEAALSPEPYDTLMMPPSALWMAVGSAPR
jgi:hypothetical protein